MTMTNHCTTKPDPSAEMVERTFPLDLPFVEKFNRRVRSHERSVVLSAVVLQWLEMTEPERAAMRDAYNAALGAAYDMHPAAAQMLGPMGRICGAIPRCVADAISRAARNAEGRYWIIGGTWMPMLWTLANADDATLTDAVLSAAEWIARQDEATDTREAVA